MSLQLKEQVTEKVMEYGNALERIVDEFQPNSDWINKIVEELLLSTREPLCDRLTSSEALWVVQKCVKLEEDVVLSGEPVEEAASTGGTFHLIEQQKAAEAAAAAAAEENRAQEDFLEAIEEQAVEEEKRHAADAAAAAMSPEERLFGKGAKHPSGSVSQQQAALPPSSPVSQKQATFEALFASPAAAVAAAAAAADAQAAAAQTEAAPRIAEKTVLEKELKGLVDGIKEMDRQIKGSSDNHECHVQFAQFQARVKEFGELVEYRDKLAATFDSLQGEEKDMVELDSLRFKVFDAHTSYEAVKIAYRDVLSAADEVAAAMALFGEVCHTEGVPPVVAVPVAAEPAVAVDAAAKPAVDNLFDEETTKAGDYFENLEKERRTNRSTSSGGLFEGIAEPAASVDVAPPAADAVGGLRR